MRNYIGYFLLSSILVFSISCQKDEVLLHEDLTIPGNKSKSYHGISSILVENYVNKIYIDLIGQKPTPVELDSAINHLNENELNEQSRIDIITAVISRSAYNDRLFQVISGILLNGTGYAEIEQFRLEYTYIRDLVYSTGDTLFGQVLDFEIIKLESVLNAPTDYKNGDITLSEYFERMCFNLIYDEINMGSENFVKACFENFYKRSVTIGELDKGVKMVDGQPTIILLKEGRNRTDFLQILSNNQEFFQGRILDAYQTLLLRLPNSSELAEATESFVELNNYQKVQIDIVKTDEYAGFE